MKLGDKLRSLRAVEGSLRGLGRSMTQQELAAAMKNEIGRGLSQAYLSQIENGARPHLTHTTRGLLAEILRTPDLAERLGEVLQPGNHQSGGQKGNGHPPPLVSLRN